jgi:SsrA-binding protein
MPANEPTTYNRKATFDYTILEKFELGIILKGTEIKAIREGKLDLSESYVTVNDGELYLVNSYIDQYSHGNINNHNTREVRKLLAHKKEIKKMRESSDVDGHTLIPIKAYFSDKGKLKVEVAVCKGKQQRDKRQDKIKKEAQREMDRAVKEKLHK